MLSATDYVLMEEICFTFTCCSLFRFLGSFLFSKLNFTRCLSSVFVSVAGSNMTCSRDFT